MQKFLCKGIEKAGTIFFFFFFNSIQIIMSMECPCDGLSVIGLMKGREGGEWH